MKFQSEASRKAFFSKLRQSVQGRIAAGPSPRYPEELKTSGGTLVSYFGTSLHSGFKGMKPHVEKRGSKLRKDIAASLRRAKRGYVKKKSGEDGYPMGMVRDSDNVHSKVLFRGNYGNKTFKAVTVKEY